MTNEEMDRLMRFILEQRAQFAAEMQRMREQRDQTDTKMAELTASLNALTEKMKKLGYLSDENE